MPCCGMPHCCTLPRCPSQATTPLLGLHCSWSLAKARVSLMHERQWHCCATRRNCCCCCSAASGSQWQLPCCDSCHKPSLGATHSGRSSRHAPGLHLPHAPCQNAQASNLGGCMSLAAAQCRAGLCTAAQPKTCSSQRALHTWLQPATSATWRHGTRSCSGMMHICCNTHTSAGSMQCCAHGCCAAAAI
jgi:hypothetical protein